MKQRMTNITFIGLALIVCLTVLANIVPGCADVAKAAIGAVAAITGLHNIGRGVEDGMTKFKAVANGNKKGGS